MRKYFIVINLFILSAGVFIITDIISFNISKRLEPPASTKDIRDMADTEKEKSMPIEAYNIILERNIFNSKRLTEGAPLPVAGDIKPFKEEKSYVPIKLIGTAAGDPSYAIIVNLLQRDQRVFRVNDTIAPGIELAEISRNMIVIMRDGVREEIRLDTENRYQGMGYKLTQPMVDPASSESAEGSPASPGRNISGSVRVTEGEGNDKDSSIPLSEGMSRLLTQAKLVENISGGESDGFMIHSIESGSLYDTIGLQDGDVIQQINGLDLKDPKDALNIYQVVKDHDFFVIDFVHDGNKVGITTLDSNVLTLLISLYRSGY